MLLKAMLREIVNFATKIICRENVEKNVEKERRMNQTY